MGSGCFSCTGCLCVRVCVCMCVNGGGKGNLWESFWALSFGAFDS